MAWWIKRSRLHSGFGNIHYSHISTASLSIGGGLEGHIVYLLCIQNLVSLGLVGREGHGTLYISILGLQCVVPLGVIRLSHRPAAHQWPFKPFNYGNEICYMLSVLHNLLSNHHYSNGEPVHRLVDHIPMIKMIKSGL